MGPPPAGLEQIEQVFSSVVSVIVGLGFIVLLVMLIWAGFKYLMSGGEPKAVSAAHQTVTWALLGMVFMALAWLILQLIKAFTGIDVTFFDIKTLCVLPNGKNICQP
ncbi:hypothetical protein HYZ05_01010 [Candidatus Daviesbacteria bacterium]|nr:hypothetical protein [Candidatus Daviesbacteria bacterium]